MGFTEFLTIGVIALLVIGPRQLPEVARVVGRLINEFKRATEDITGGFMEAGYELKESFDKTREEIIGETEKIKESITDFDQEKNFSRKDQKNNETENVESSEDNQSSQSS